MPAIQVITGPYGLYVQHPTFGNSYFPLGHVEKEGVICRWTHHGQRLQTAFTGEGLMDGIYVGKDLTLHLTVMEPALGTVRHLMNPSPRSNVDEGLIASQSSSATSNFPLGAIWSSYACSLKMLPLLGTAAATVRASSDGGNGRKMRVMLANNQEVEERLNVQARTIPLVLNVIPFVKQNSGVTEFRLFDWVDETALLSAFNFVTAPA